MRRFFIVSVVLGALLLLATPAIRNTNNNAWQVKRDTATVPYFMRSGIMSMFSMCGFTLVLGGLMGISLTRKVHGRLAQHKASAGALPVYVFAISNFASGIIALPYLPEIYSTSGNKHSSIPFDLDGYYKLKGIANGFAIAAFFVFMVYRFLRLRKIESTNKPACQNCGYSLRGLKNHTCPECGTAFHP